MIINWNKTISLWGGLLIMMVFLQGKAGAYALLQENFSECTSGGSITHGTNTTGTTGMSPQTGTVGVFAGDDAVITTGLAGSLYCLQAKDDVVNNELRLLFNTASHVKSGPVTLSFQFEAPSALGGTAGPLMLYLADATSMSGSRFLVLYVYKDLHMLFTNSTTSLTGGGYSTGTLTVGKVYQVTLVLNLNTFTYSFTIQNVTDSTTFLSVANLSFVNDAGIATTGVGAVDVYYGFPDFGGSGTTFDFGNLSLTAGGAVFGAADDEFLGPFSSWINVKNYPYNATGNGTTDDTAAIQSALNAAGTSAGSVVYFPAGTYLISPTLNTTCGLLFQSKQFVGIIGQDPLTTRIKWGGSSTSTVPMLWLNGTRFCHFGRITWDGNGSTVTGIAEQQNTSLSSVGSYHNFHTDERFENMAIGVALGKTATNYGVNDADNTFIRDHFLACSQAGVRTGSQNSFQNFFWDCEFVDCSDGADTGPLNSSGSGGFDIYRSYFQNSSYADVYMTSHVYGFDLRGNYSIGSNQFVNGNSQGNQTADSVQLQDNTIVNTTQSVSVNTNEPGTYLLTDNQIQSSPGAVGPAVLMNTTLNGFIGPDLCSIGNTYTVSNPVLVEGSSASYYTQNDTVVGSINTTPPTMPGTPANLGRPSMDVAAGSTAAQINALMTTGGWAYTKWGQRPVLHFPAGNYNINATITVPAGLDVQFVGDCGGTSFTWTGASNGTMIQLTGPSLARISDIYLVCMANASGIVVTNPDQSGGQVYVDGGSWDQFVYTALYVNPLSYTTVECHDFFAGGVFPAASDGALLVNVIGSGSASTTGYTAIFGSDGSSYPVHGATFRVSSDAQLDVVDHYCEQLPAMLINLTGTAPNFVTFAGEVGAPSASTYNVPWIELFNSSGNATFLNCWLGYYDSTTDPYIYISNDNSTGNALFLGFVAYTTTETTGYFGNNEDAGGTASFFNGYYENSAGSTYPVSNGGSTLTSSFVTSMLAQSRAIKPAYPSQNTSQSITTVRLTNVLMTNPITALQVGP